MLVHVDQGDYENYDCDEDDYCCSTVTTVADAATTIRDDNDEAESNDDHDDYSSAAWNCDNSKSRCCRSRDAHSCYSTVYILLFPCCRIR